MIDRIKYFNINLQERMLPTRLCSLIHYSRVTGKCIFCAFSEITEPDHLHMTRAFVIYQYSLQYQMTLSADSDGPDQTTLINFLRDTVHIHVTVRLGRGFPHTFMS